MDELTESDRQLADVEGVVTAHNDQLDWDNIAYRANELGLARQLDQLKTQC